MNGKERADMHIYIDDHARERAEERGTNEEEIIETIKQGNEGKAKNNRLAKEKVFAFAKEWNGKYYDEGNGYFYN